MADQKVTQLTENTAPVLTDITYLVDSPGGSPASQKITLQSLRRVLTPYSVCNGRLTLTSGTPITTSDVNNATTVYWTPVDGNQVGLYDGSSGWDILEFSELSLAVGAYTASKPFDFFVYNNSGSAALESLEWTDATNRATALTTQDGILVKSGATTRRYIGTVYIDSDQKTDDSVTKRFVWNYYNRVGRRLYKTESTQHTTNSGWRYWNNSSAEIVEYVCGIVDDLMYMSIFNVTLVSSSTSSGAYIALGVDINNNRTAGTPYASTTTTTTQRIGNSSKIYPSLGYHYIACVEGTDGSNATFSVYEMMHELLG